MRAAGPPLRIRWVMKPMRILQVITPSRIAGAELSNELQIR